MTSSIASPQASAAGGGRWAIASAAIVVMIFAGTAYAWSNFSQPLTAAFGWNTTQTSLVFGIAIFSLGIGAVIGGRWQDRAGPRPVTVTGIVLWGAGNLLAAIGPHTSLWFDLTYGVIGGLGNGMAYVTPVATVTKWFPDKRGLASGLVVMGFGLGAFFYGFILKAIPAFVTASKHAAAYVDAATAAKKAGTVFDPAPYALTATDISTLLGVFLFSGIVYAIVGGLAASMMRNPPAGYTVAGVSAKAASAARSYSPSEVLHMPQLYLLWLMLFLNVVAGILIVSNAVPIIRELISKDVTDTDTLHALAAQAIGAYAFVAVFNGLGRFFWGAVSDRLGRNTAYALIYGAQVLVFVVLGGLHVLPLVLVAFAIILACYGGGFAVMPSFNADYFGTKYLGQNYGFILTAWGLGGLVGPSIAGAVKDRTGSYSGALFPMAIMLAVAIILPFVTKKPLERPAVIGAARPAL